MKSDSVEKIRSLSHEKNPKKKQQNRTKTSQEGENRNSQNNSSNKQKIILGICAMKKKVQSKPMRQILKRLQCSEIQIIEMWQNLENHWSSWPKVDALICFHSDGFPYVSAWKYVKKVKPFLINSLEKQQLLWDRTVVYDILKSIKVPVAKHFLIYRDINYIDAIEDRGWGNIIPDQEGQSKRSSNYEEKEEKQKPKFQKKQTQQETNSENKQKIEHKSIHRFPTFHQRGEPLFFEENDGQSSPISNSRLSKINSNNNPNKYKKRNINFYPKSLRYYHQSRLDKITQYQVQEVEDHINIKLGDQIINKLSKPFVQKPFDSQNHEICIYYPQSMGGGRKKLFRKIKNASSQYQGNQNCIRRDGNYIYEEFLPTNAFDIKVYTIGPYYMYAQARKAPTLDGVVQRNKDGKEMRYPVILTPQQKFICNRIVQQFQQQVCGFDLLRSNGKSYVCDVNGWSFVKSNPKYWDDCAFILKKKIFDKFFPQKIIVQSKKYDRFDKNQLNEYRPSKSNINVNVKVQELRSIVSIFRHGDRSPKLKLKIKTKDKRFLEFFDGKTKDELKLKDAKNLTKILDITYQMISETQHKDPLFKDLIQMKIVLESGGHFEGFTRKIQLKVSDRAQGKDNQLGKVKKIVIVLKWGGALSRIGKLDAIQLGKKMRQERYDDHKDTILSLHSSYKHDLKTYSSDQGRCIKTAAAFLKGFLNIQGDQLAPIITSMVGTNAKAQSNFRKIIELLDCTSQQNHSELTQMIQDRLSQIMNSNQPLIDSYLKYAKEEEISDSMFHVLRQIGRPREKLEQLENYLDILVEYFNQLFFQDCQENKGQKIEINYVDQEQSTDDFENISMINDRWSKLKKDFYDPKTKLYNISKVPQIFDTIRHDLKKNTKIFNSIKEPQKLKNFHRLSKTLAYFVVPNEYGINDQQKVKTATNICLPLLQKILIDLMFWKEKNYGEELYWKYKNTGQSDNWRHIRTRLYFTSASHMYSILNILSLGNNRELLKKQFAEENAYKVRNILYMSYLSHIEFRLYENLNLQKENPNRFRMEISVSTEYKKKKEMKQFTLGQDKGFTINEIQQFIQSFVLLKDKLYPVKSEGFQDKKQKNLEYSLN